MTDLTTLPPSGLVAAKEDTLEPIAARGGKRFWHRFAKERLAVASFIFIVFVVVVALTAHWIAPFDPIKQNIVDRLQGPSGEHLLGTDGLGRDTLSRVIYGARVSVLASAEATGIALALGVIPGLLAGFHGGRLDRVITLITDTLLTFPPLILAIAVAGTLGAGLTNAMIAVGITLAPAFIRVTRGATIAIREETFVEAARISGCSNARILGAHLVPNIFSTLIVQVAITAGVAMLAEAGLSFLGLGAQPPQASWGSMIRLAQETFRTEPWTVLAPGIAISLTVLAFSVLGTGLRDAFGRTKAHT